MPPGRAARRSFEIAKFLSSRLARPHSERQRGDLESINRPSVNHQASRHQHPALGFPAAPTGLGPKQSPYARYAPLFRASSNPPERAICPEPAPETLPVPAYGRSGSRAKEPQEWKTATERILLAPVETVQGIDGRHIAGCRYSTIFALRNSSGKYR